MRTGPLIHLAILVAAAAGTAARAEEIPEPFTPVRPIGMGGAFTAVANDESSVWTNPAGIARSRKARSRDVANLIKVPNLVAGANTEARSFYEGYKGSGDQSVEGVIASIDELGDKPFWARAAAFPVGIFNVSRTTPMALGAFSNTTVKAVIPHEDPTQARVEAISDVGGVVSFAFTNDSNRFAVGVSARPTKRFAYEDNIPSDALLDKAGMQARLAADSNSSQGVGVDFGTLFTIADFWYPTFGFSVLNLPTGCRKDYLNPFTEKRETVCGNVYSGDFANEDALSTVDPTDVRAGISITPRLSRKLSARLALDVHQIPISTGDMNYGLKGIDAAKLLHAGIEIFAGNPLLISDYSVRAGYSQGFMTFGASVNFGYFEIQFATYGRDVSSSAKPIEDRRVMGSLTFDF